MRRHRSAAFRTAILFSIVAVLGVFPATAARIRRLSLNDIRSKAQRILVGEVLSQSTRVGEGGKMVWTDYQLRVSETLKGTDPGAITTVSFAGGQAGGLDIGLSDVPTLEVGRRYVLFMQSGDLHPTPTVGWGQGLFHVSQIKDGTVNRSVIVSEDGEPLEIDAAGLLTRGPRVVISEGKIVVAAKVDPHAAQQKMAEPVALNADGTPAPTVARIQPLTVAPRHNYATMNQLRMFAHGRLEAAGPKSRIQ